MSKVRFRIAMSLDGYTSGPQQSKENPLGIGGEQLHEWAFPLVAWRAPHGPEGGRSERQHARCRGLLSNLGATIMGGAKCGHFQHVRHTPPWQERPWVLTPEGRAGRLGTRLLCRLCEQSK